MKKITILLLTAAAMASGCKRFTDINANPNQPTSVTPNVVLSAALNSSAGDLATDFDRGGQSSVVEWMGYFSRSGNYITVQSTEQYSLGNGYADPDFQDLFLTMSKYNYIEGVALASPSTLAFYAGVAKTMKAYHYATAINAFGNVPYSQAFNITKYPTPAYDDAQGIYDKLVTQLDSAVYYFGVASTFYQTAPGTTKTLDDKYDIMFGRGAGVDPTLRMTEWTEFANTVKLMILMTESQVSGKASYITSEIAKATASGGFLPAGTSAAVNPGYTSANQAQLNPFYGEFFTAAGGPNNDAAFYRANTYAINFYQGKNATGNPVATAAIDSWRPVLVYAPVSGTTVVGNYDGDPNSLTNSFTSAIGPGVLKAPTQDELIMSDFESLFLQAEATARGYLTGPSADALVQSAIEQNFVYLGDNATDADAYYASGSADPNTSVTAAAAAVGALPTNVDKTPGLQAIMTQKWIALNSINWMGAWTDYRRTQFPLSSVLGLSHANTHFKNALPYRMPYPQSEYDTNGKNVPSLANGAYTPLFWDKFEH